MAKFTFKKVPRTGRFRCFEREETEIKLNKKIVGSISEGKDTWYIRFAIKKNPTEKEPAPFKWITLKYKPDDEADAREFIRKHNDEIQKRYDLHYFD